MIILALSIWGLLCCLILLLSRGIANSTGSASASLSANLTISLNQGGDCSSAIPILAPGRLFGSFFEEFVHAGDGGIYAEKIANRAFQQDIVTKTSFPFHPHRRRHTGSEEGWNIVQGQAARKDLHHLNNATRHFLSMSPRPSAPVVIRNVGYPGGMAVQAEEVLLLSFFVYLQIPSENDGDSAVSLTASLVSPSSAKQSPSTLSKKKTLIIHTNATSPKQDSDIDSLVIPPGVWTKIQMELQVSSLKLDVEHDSYPNRKGRHGQTPFIPCEFQLEAHANTTMSVAVTVVSLVSKTNTWKEEGLFRQDVMEWMTESQPPFLRTPGGCYVEGQSFEGSWDWKQTLGPIEQRPGHFNDRWGYFDTDGLGMLEYLLMAEEMGAKPLLVVNAGCTMKNCLTKANLGSYVQDTLDALEFAMGDAENTVWGAKRAAGGHALPFDLEALGIGNENCHSNLLPQYAYNWLEIASAVRKVYPNLTLALGCETPQQVETVLQMVPAIGAMTNTLVDFHIRYNPKSFLDNAHFFDALPRGENVWPKIFVSEYSSPRRVFPNGVDAAGAVAEAIYMLGMEANGDIVQLASYGDLLANTEDLTLRKSKDYRPPAGISTILIDAKGSIGTPSWIIQTLFMQNQAFNLLPSSLHNAVLTTKSSIPKETKLQIEEWRNGGTIRYEMEGQKESSMLAVSVSTASDGDILVKAANYGTALASIHVQFETHARECTVDTVQVTSMESEAFHRSPPASLMKRILVRGKEIPTAENKETSQFCGIELVCAPFSVHAFKLIVTTSERGPTRVEEDKEPHSYSENAFVRRS